MLFRFSKYISSIILCSLSVIITSCHDIPDYDNNLNDNLTILSEIIKTRYCFLDEKNINWDSITLAYHKKLKPKMTYGEFFDLCADMLNELQDGHVNLSSNFNTSSYKKWWTDYPQDFNLRTLQQYYLKFNYSQVGSLLYKEIRPEIGYIYYTSFSSTISENLMDNVLLTFKDCKALIIDVRNNGGGNLTNIQKFVGRFITEDFTGGYISYKNGPDKNDFSEPYPIIYHPTENHISWDKPIIVISNRSSYSAANDFIAVMKELPNVTHVGAKTGGGGGLPFTSELPIGWSVRFSTSPVTDARHQSIEMGISPMPQNCIHSLDIELANGNDAILDFAIRKAELL